MRELIHKDQLKGHKAVVVGAGSSGRAAVRLLLALGADVKLLDSAEPGDAVKAFVAETGVPFESGTHTKAQFDGVDMVVLSPGIAVAALADVLADIPQNKIIAQ